MDDVIKSATEKQLEDFFEETPPEITPEFDRGWRLHEIDREIAEYESKDALTITEMEAKKDRLEDLEAERQRLLPKETVGNLHDGSVREALRELAKARIKERAGDPDKKIPGWERLKKETGYSRVHIHKLCTEILGHEIHKRDDRNKQSDVYLYDYEIEMIRIYKSIKPAKPAEKHS